MKKNKIALISVTFILGIVFGVSLFAILAFASSESPEPNPPVIISSAEARTIFYNYFNSAGTITGKQKGYTVDKEQIQVLNSLASEYPSITRFRIYMGKDSHGIKLGIVLGVDSEGKDFVAGRIYQTNSPLSGPCPDLCDVDSPITK